MSKKPMSDKEAADALFQATALVALGIVLLVAIGSGIWMFLMVVFH
jgi:hypothetical protein